ncbi:MAG: hypothetical protein ABFD89_10020 [Bryobacteraceae bacterium]
MAVKIGSEYRRHQRHLGEIQVALGLANGVHKAMPGNQDLSLAVVYLLRCKAELFNRILAMEIAGELG